MGVTRAEKSRIGAFYTFVLLLSWPALRLLYRFRATGVENIPQEGGFVLAANHASNFDPWPLATPLFPRRALRFMSKAELFNPIIGPPLRALGGFRIERGSNSDEGIATAIRLVQAGEVVAMFPQGTRVQKGLRKKIQPRARTGAARIALEARSPLVPAAIKGTDRLLRLGRMGVAYGEPIVLDDLRDLEPKEAAEAATDRLMEAIAELMRSL